MTRAHLAGALWAAVLAGVVIVASAGCGSDPSAPYFPATRVAATPPPGPEVTGAAAVAAHSQVALRGPVSRPDPKLTPGAIATTRTAEVCSTPRKSHALFSRTSSVIALVDQQAVFTDYKITPQQQLRYGLDFLVPLQLGGANARTNIWPAVVVGNNRGAGFREKEVLNIRLHVLVCHGEMQLAQAQHDIATDWVSLWQKYGA